MSERITVAPEAEFGDPDRQIVDVDGASVGVFRIDGEFYALRNECLHQGGPVCKGQVRPGLEADYPGPGEQIEEDIAGDLTVACPWHGYTYHLETGEHVGSGEYELPTFEVVVDDGIVYVEL